MEPDGGAKRDTHPVASIFLAVFGLAVAVISLRYGFGTFETPDAGFFPFFTGLPMAFFSAMTLQSLRRGWMPLRSLQPQ